MSQLAWNLHLLLCYSEVMRGLPKWSEAFQKSEANKWSWPGRLSPNQDSEDPENIRVYYPVLLFSLVHLSRGIKMMVHLWLLKGNVFWPFWTQQGLAFFRNGFCNWTLSFWQAFVPDTLSMWLMQATVTAFGILLPKLRENYSLKAE